MFLGDFRAYPGWRDAASDVEALRRHRRWRRRWVLCRGTTVGGCRMERLNATAICSSSSAHRRFQEWEQAGVFHEIWRQGLLDYDAVVGIDWAWLAADGALGKAPLGGA